jgi:hypothetical protein
MGIYATATVSRNAALRTIKEKLDSCSNKELEYLLFSMFEGKPPFRNFYVTDSREEPDDEELEGRIDIDHDE